MKRWWDAVKPPPAPRPPYQRDSPLLPPWYKTVWKELLPPPRAEASTPGALLWQKRRRGMALWGAAVLAAGGCVWAVRRYRSGAPARADQAFQQGMALMGLNDLPGAERQFRRAAEIRPRLAKAFLERGLTRRARQNLDGSAADFKQALELDPKLEQAHTELGLIYRERGNLDRALHQFTLALQAGANTDALFQRGQLYAALGQHKKAIEDYDAAIQQLNDAPYAYRARAESREALGDHNGAEKDRQIADAIEHRLNPAAVQ